METFSNCTLSNCFFEILLLFSVKLLNTASKAANTCKSQTADRTSDGRTNRTSLFKHSKVSLSHNITPNYLLSYLGGERHKNLLSFPSCLTPLPATLSSSGAGNVSFWRSAGWRSEDDGISWEKGITERFFFLLLLLLSLPQTRRLQKPSPPPPDPDPTSTSQLRT